MNTPLKSQIRISGSVAGCALRGDFDVWSREPFLTAVDELLQRGVCRLVLNMRRVRFLSSSGLSALIKARNLLHQAGGELVLSQASAEVTGTIALLGLDHRLMQRNSDESAVFALS